MKIATKPKKYNEDTDRISNKLFSCFGLEVEFECLVGGIVVLSAAVKEKKYVHRWKT
jgi:hypothetical protein